MTLEQYQIKLQQLLPEIPRGRVTSYKVMAQAMKLRGYRWIGRLLHQNPDPDRYPCYKVVRSDGSLGGFARGTADKIQRLKRDGIRIRKGKIINFEQIFYSFK